MNRVFLLIKCLFNGVISEFAVKKSINHFVTIFLSVMITVYTVSLVANFLPYFKNKTSARERSLSPLFGRSKEVVNNYENGQILEKYFVKKDRAGNYIKHGKYERFYENGMIQYECLYQRGSIKGYVTMYSEEGIKISDYYDSIPQR